MKPLTRRDLEALGELRTACDNWLRVHDREWVRPLDCGGYNGSDHSYRLNKLARAGLAEAKKRAGYTRGSKMYRITDAGRALLSSPNSRDGSASGRSAGD